jgi:hypothetical protein
MIHILADESKLSDEDARQAESLLPFEKHS